MSLILQITLTILTVLTINGCIAIGIYVGNLKDKLYPLYYYPLGIYVLVSMILTCVAICYIPFMLIWHLY